MISALKNQENLTIMTGDVGALVMDGRRAAGVELDGRLVSARAVVVATGTFLNGRMWRGAAMEEGGRLGEAASKRLTDSLRALGLPLRRLKTGTPPRLAHDSIDYEGLAVQEPDLRSEPFSFLTERIGQPQIPCHIARTNAQAMEVVGANIALSPKYNGSISSAGPRYCPSIEDKAVRFPHNSEHHIFLERMGAASPAVYPNGISTGLPAEVQDRFLRFIKGLENVRVLAYGYAIEYDCLDPLAITPFCAVKDAEGLFTAGQINSTTGYEEAAAQGLLAGINAALHAAGREPFITRRHESYIGVMMDDLTVQGASEPYRMFTSRSEYRLSLRGDNADRRLTDAGVALGVVGRARAAAWERKKAAPDSPAYAAAQAKYAPYLARQAAEAEAIRRSEAARIPADFPYDSVGGLSAEVRERLAAARPYDIAAAGRVEGVTPAAVAALLVALRKSGAIQGIYPQVFS